MVASEEERRGVQPDLRERVLYLRDVVQEWGGIPLSSRIVWG